MGIPFYSSFCYTGNGVPCVTKPPEDRTAAEENQVTSGIIVRHEISFAGGILAQTNKIFGGSGEIFILVVNNIIFSREVCIRDRDTADRSLRKFVPDQHIGENGKSQSVLTPHTRACVLALSQIRRMFRLCPAKIPAIILRPALPGSRSKKS